MKSDKSNSELLKWKEKNRRGRSYAHFDAKINLCNDFHKIWEYINNENKVATHGFYPFIHFEISTRKFGFDEVKKKKIKKDPKDRPIYYSAHMDRYIYSYYGYKLNQHYNARLADDAIDDVSIAYRNNKDRDNDNIYYARKAFERIKDLRNCYVIIGDFKSFFDELDHTYLKERLLDLLKDELPKPGELSKDYYTVFKNITKFSFWEIENLFSINRIKVSMKNPESIRRAYNNLNKKEVALSYEDFKLHKKEQIKRNREEKGKGRIKDYGVPQGSAISAVLSNIYMIEFDKKMYKLIMDDNNGLYMRYSDDFIVILPKCSEDEFSSHYNEIKEIIKSVRRLCLESKKTQIFLYRKGHIERRCPESLSDILEKSSQIDYLGFTFDGEKITIRDKTLSKYYYRMYRKLKTILNSREKGKRRSAENLYQKYTIKGAFPSKNEEKNGNKHKGNFVSYAHRIKKEFSNSKYEFGIDEAVDKFIERHRILLHHV